MEDEDGLEQVTVDPQVRAHIYSLVSALGGTGANEQGRYVLGDEALACLKDLKRWLKLYDERLNRLDVARCMAEANIVEGDLLPILAGWAGNSTSKSKILEKVALTCLELLVPLTWPIDKNDAEMTVNHHRHIPYLQKAQLSYKRAVLEHTSSCVLRTAVRTALPAIAMSAGDRSARDEGIIKLLLYFCRNVAMIKAPPNTHVAEVSRSSTIEAFQQQDVLALLLTITSNIGDDFSTQDTVILEVLFFLLKGVEVDRLFLDKQQIRSQNQHELRMLMSREQDMLRGYAQTAPSRHNRFGTMIWVQRDGAGRHSTVSGQDVLKNDRKTLSRMDQSKKWNKPRQKAKYNDDSHDRFDLAVPLLEAPRQHLRVFVEEFLDSGFNPLFSSLRRAVEREADRVLDTHKLQLFYVAAWCLQAERVRRRQQAERVKRDPKLGEGFEPDSFGLVSSVLIQEFFVLLNRFMQNALDLKLWRDLQAGMRCLTEILLIVQDMTESPLDEDQEIAENIQNRIFYEGTTHDQVLSGLRLYKDQGFGYLDACTELAHIFLRMLERYSKQNVDLQIRSKRRRRAKKKKDEALTEAVSSEEEENVEKVSQDRKFNFDNFSAKFMTQACVDTFVQLTKFYNDLSPDQLKRAHRFFHRVAFKVDLSVLLFRVDIITLFNRMMQGPDGLNKKSGVFREWDDLVRQILRKMVKKLEQRPELLVEMLFSKDSSTVFYLEHGHDRASIAASSRAPAALEVKGALPLDEQIGIVVAALSKEHQDMVRWFADSLKTAAVERDIPREGREQTTSSPPPVDDVSPYMLQAPAEDIRFALFKNARLRLLLTLCSCSRGGEDQVGAKWSIPASLSASELRRLSSIIVAHLQTPVLHYGEEEIPAEDMLRRKQPPTRQRQRALYDDDEDDSEAQDEEDFLFPAGGPTNTVEAALDTLRAKRGKKRRNDGDGKSQAARRQARVAADMERRRGIKSAQFVEDSETDEERDREFFAHEASRRLEQRDKVMGALTAGTTLPSRKKVKSGDSARESSPSSGSMEPELTPLSTPQEMPEEVNQELSPVPQRRKRQVFWDDSDEGS